MRNHMDANHQGTTSNNLVTTENKLWLPPLSPKDQKKLKRLQKKSFAEKMGFANKTPWDFVQLLLIPVAIALGTALFGYINIQITLDQQRQTTLESYIHDMNDLIFNKGLRTSKPPNAEVRATARAETVITLRQLDGDRKGLLIQFLCEE